jgi:hypothetical protein
VQLAPPSLHAGLIALLNKGFRRVALALTEFENYKARDAMRAAPPPRRR